jgi:hypothetical protein
MMPELAPLLAKGQALVDAITFDENGAMVAGEWRGGNGGMVSRSTIMAADALRAELLAWQPARRAAKTGLSRTVLAELGVKLDRALVAERAALVFAETPENPDGTDEGQRAFEAASRRTRAVAEQIAAIPAVTLDDLRVKAKAFAWAQDLARMHPESLQCRLTHGLVDPLLDGTIPAPPAITE